MDWNYDLITNVLTPAETQPSQIPLKWRSRELMRLQFLRTGTAELLPTGYGLALRLIGTDGTVLADVTSWTTPATAAGWYEADLILHTDALTTAFTAAATKSISASIEQHWWRTGQAATPYISDNLLSATVQRPLALPEAGSPIVLEGAEAWLSDRVNRYYPAVTGRTGGGATKLDGIATTSLDLRSLVMLVINDGTYDLPESWMLKTRTSETEDGTGYVIPDDDEDLVWIKIA